MHKNKIQYKYRGILLTSYKTTSHYQKKWGVVYVDINIWQLFLSVYSICCHLDSSLFQIFPLSITYTVSFFGVYDFSLRMILQSILAIYIHWQLQATPQTGRWNKLRTREVKPLTEYHQTDTNIHPKPPFEPLCKRKNLPTSDSPPQCCSRKIWVQPQFRVQTNPKRPTT